MERMMREEGGKASVYNSNELAERVETGVGAYSEGIAAKGESKVG